MPLVLDATVGGSAANSYATMAEGNTYHEKRLFASGWTGAVDATKEAALVWATQLLDDGMEWYGYITDLTTPQALDNPRTGLYDKESRVILSTEIATPIKEATAELGRLLIAADRPAEVETIGFKSIKVGPIELEIDKYDQLAVIPDAVYEQIKDFGRRINRGSSFKQVTLLRA